MRWSSYSVFFQSKRNGWLLYNTGSGNFLSVADDAVFTIQSIQKDVNAFDFSKLFYLYYQLRNGGFITTDTGDDDMINMIQVQRSIKSYDTSRMMLTIAPTRMCNFNCRYCYESDRPSIHMNAETEKAVVDFVSRSKNCKSLSVTWYGGEPTLAFDTIVRMTTELKKLVTSYTAVMVTNGYALSFDMISQFNALTITKLQITIDGTREVHDSRRCLQNGGRTFNRIIQNIDLLLSGIWNGYISIRVNVDKTNSYEYEKVYRYIHSRYHDAYGKRISVYPGYVHDNGKVVNTDCFTSEDKFQFVSSLFYDSHISDLDLFPTRKLNSCTAGTYNAYVVGPDGELYKCWNDIGNSDAVIGSVYADKPWNFSLLARYMHAANISNMEECRECKLFPLCNGGCTQLRVLNSLGKQKRSFCSYFKTHLPELLEMHYERKKVANE